MKPVMEKMTRFGLTLIQLYIRLRQLFQQMEVQLLNVLLRQYHLLRQM